MTMELQFKVLKRGIKVSGLIDGDGKAYAINLSMKMWQAMCNVVPYEFVHLHEDSPLKGRLKIGGWISTSVTDGMKERGLIEGVTFTYERTYGHVSNTRTEQGYASGLLTELGLAVHHQLPPCPSEKEWAPSSGLSNPKNIKLSDTQRGVLEKWKPKDSEAVPVGSDHVETSKWISDEGMVPTFRALLRMELIEPGVRGVRFDDGKLILDHAKDSQDLQLVYRRTVLGALVVSG